MAQDDIATTRRDLLAVAAGALGAALAPSAVAAQAAHGPWRTFRRVVTSTGADGKGRVLVDGAPTNSFEFNGTRITRLWEASGLPVPLPLASDAGATAGNAYRAGFRGTSFYVAELPAGVGRAQIPLHKNDTLDYMAVMSGEVVFVLEGREIELKAGDLIVQGGNLHTWENRGTETCVLLFVVVTGEAAAAPSA
jgi:mannose-6-phosphate isomerase-like protein (cupin superfamily)